MPTPAAGGLRAATATPVRPADHASPDDTFVLAVDLGTGGPKVALLSASGRVAAHAFEPVGVTLSDDGGAEQSPQAWWDAIVSCARRALADSGVAPERVVGVGCTSQWSGTVAVDDAGDAIGPSIIWMDSRGARAVRETVRGAVNVQGYSASKLARWVRKTGGIPSLSGKDPVGHIHFLRTQRPDVYAATAVFLEPVDYLNLRLTGLARASHDSITVHWVTDNRNIGAPSPMTTPWSSWPGSTAPPCPTSYRRAVCWAGSRPVRRPSSAWCPAPPVVAGTGDLHSAAVGSGAVADFAGHLYIGTSSWISCHVPFKKTDALTNIALDPLGHPRQVPGGRRARDRRGLPHLAARQRALPWRCLVVGRPAAPPKGSSPSSTTWPASVPPGPTASCSPPGSTGSARRWTTTPSAGGFTTSRCRRPGRTWSVPSSRASRSNSAWLLGAVEKFCKRPFDSLAFVGGGANSDLWSQMHADATGRAIRQVADPVLANVRGAGLLTHVALGHMTLDDIPGTVAVKATYRAGPGSGRSSTRSG